MPAIKFVNNLKDNTLEVNQKLIIPTSDKVFHIVDRGETLFRISRSSGLSVDRIRSLNGLSDNTLNVGDTLSLLPLDSLRAILALESEKALTIDEGSNKKVVVHTVKQGESLYKIARLYNLTVQELRKLNQLKSNNLQIGQELLITQPVVAPVVVEESVSGTQGTFSSYTIDQGESLPEVLAKFEMDAQDFSQLNPGVTAKDLRQGLTITVLKPPTRYYQNPYKIDFSPSDTLSGTRVNILGSEARGRVLTNGTMFSPDQFLISHPTLEIGSEVQVSSLDDERQVFALVAQRSKDEPVWISKRVADVLNLQEDNSRVIIRRVDDT